MVVVDLNWQKKRSTRARIYRTIATDGLFPNSPGFRVTDSTYIPLDLKATYFLKEARDQSQSG